MNANLNHLRFFTDITQRCFAMVNAPENDVLIVPQIGHSVFLPDYPNDKFIVRDVCHGYFHDGTDMVDVLVDVVKMEGLDND